MTMPPNHQRPNAALVGLRPFEIEQDVQLIYRWLSDEDVRVWYDEGEHSLDNYSAMFAPEDHNHQFIIEIDGDPAGYVQAYRLSDEPEYQRQLGLDHDAVSLDIMLGERHFRGKGWGSVVLRAALDRIVFGQMNAGYACINPDPKNERAVRAYEKAGFHGDRVVYVLDEENPQNTGHERIMTISRAEFYESKA